MNFAGPNHHATKLYFAFFIILSSLLAGCGGGGGGGANGNSSVQLSKIAVFPSSISVAQGQTVKLTAIASYADGTISDVSSQVIWTAVAPLLSPIVSVNTSGVVTGGAVLVSTTTTVTAKLNGLTSTPANITVTPGVAPQATTGLATSRWDHTGTLFAASGVASSVGGKVLVAGGCIGNNSICVDLDSSELYDPGNDQWTVSSGRLNMARHDHTATQLTGGQILVAGGNNITDIGSDIASAELYDPNTQLWTLTGSLNDARAYHTATLLPDGTVLVVGGGGSLQSTELYTPPTAPPGAVSCTLNAATPSPGCWARTGPLATGRYSHTATLIPSTGQVLVIGGVDINGSYLSSSELYDPGTKKWSAGPNLNIGRYSHTATLLTSGPNAGKVLVIGGVPASAKATNTVELCDPAATVPSTCALLPTTSNLIAARSIHSATLLTGTNTGKILVMFGDGSDGNEVSSIELYDTTTLTSSPMLSQLPARDNFAAVLLTTGPNAGKVLAAGGFDGTTSIANSDLLGP